MEELVNKIKAANVAYRTGQENAAGAISDVEYDLLLEELYELDPNHEIFNQVGLENVDESRKVKLPIEMASMEKLKTMDDIATWVRLKRIDPQAEVVLTPKFDGLSFCVEEEVGVASTRGDGVYGQRSTEHFKLVNNQRKKSIFKYTNGEVIMSEQTFTQKYAQEFANPRNLVAGLFNSKTVSPALQDVDYIKYGASPIPANFTTKSAVLDELNQDQKYPVHYQVVKLVDLTEDLLLSLFKDWSVDYKIDGVIIEINDLAVQEKLGRETSTQNPCYARAFKHSSFVDEKETEILSIEWNISKNGLVKPILHVRPINLDGVMVSRCTGNNAKFVKEMGLGTGAIVKIVRSGMVIPLVTEVLKTVPWELPVLEGVELAWNENEIELITVGVSDEQRCQQLISFFAILEVDNVGEGVVRQLFEAGYQTIADILALTVSDLEKLERFGKRKASLVHNAIHSKMVEVDLAKLQHASGLFTGLGSKKLALLTHFATKPSLWEVMEIEGFAQKSAEVYISNYDSFWNFVQSLPLTIKKEEERILTSNDLVDQIFVFTGVRSAAAEEAIESRGGKIGSSVSKNTTYLVMKTKNSGSAKEEKALALGVQILTLAELNSLLQIS